MALAHVLSSVEIQKCLWSTSALRSAGKLQVVAALVTVTPQDRMFPAPGKGQQKGKSTPALQLLSSQTAEDGPVLIRQAGIWCGQGTHIPHCIPVLGSCSAVGKAVSAPLDSLSR